MSERAPLRHLDLRHLRQLVVVAEKRSIRSAAKVLAITQPALSRSIRALEEELGNKLLDRGPHGTTLTKVGRTLVKYARIIDANLSLAAKEIQEVQSDAIERVTFGTSWLAELVLTSRLIDRILEHRPSIRMTTTVGDYESLAPRLMSGELDFVLGPPPLNGDTPGVSSTLLMEFPAAVVVRADHPLARRPSITYRDLANERWVLPAEGTAPRITYDNFFLRHDTPPPEPIIEVQPLSIVIKQLILHRDIATIMPLIVIEQDIADGLIKVLPFQDEIVFTMHLARRELGYHSPACEYVQSEIRSLCVELTGETQIRSVTG
jgi:DNA-binding transcriptional LysR family regulator